MKHILRTFLVSILLFFGNANTLAQESDDPIVCTPEPFLYSCQLAWSPVGNQLAVINLYDIVIWDTETMEVIATLHQEGKAPDVFVWSPDGRQIATANGNYDVNIWDIEAMEKVHTINMENYLLDDFAAGRIEGPISNIESLSWNPTADQLAISHDGSVSIWNWETDEFKTIQSDISGTNSRFVSWNSNGELLVVINSSNLVTYDGISFEKLIESNAWDNTFMVNYWMTSQSATWSPDGSRIAIALEKPYIPK